MNSDIKDHGAPAVEGELDAKAIERLMFCKVSAQVPASHIREMACSLPKAQAVIEQLKMENEILTAMKGDPAGSFEKCMQAIAERDQLKAELSVRQRKQELDACDLYALREQLDAARELLAMVKDKGIWVDLIGDWLEANKP